MGLGGLVECCEGGEIVLMQRTGDPLRQQHRRAGERRDCVRVEHRVHPRGTQHFEQVSEQPEPGDIGAGVGAVREKASGGGG